MFFLVVGDDGRLVGVEPSSEHVVAQGRLCVKGWNVHHFVNHPDRLTQPLIRRNGKLEPASWDEALDLVVSRLQAIQAAHGPNSVAFFSSAKTTNEENYLMMKLARAVFKTNNVDHCARLCHSSTVLGLAATFGSGAMTNSISCMEQADCIFVIGSNTTEQHPLIGTRIVRNKTKRGAKLIVADNRRIRLARLADLHVRHKNGTDVAFLNGLMHVIISEGLEDKEFVRTRTENYEELKKVVANYPPEKVAQICGVTPEEIVQTARMFAGADKAMIVYSMGITQHTHGVDNVKTCANLAMLTGNIGRPGTGVNPLRGQNNVQGACDMGALPNVFSGYQGRDGPGGESEVRKGLGRREPARQGGIDGHHGDRRRGGGSAEGPVHHGRESHDVRSGPEPCSQGPGASGLSRRAGHLPHPDHRVCRRGSAGDDVRGKGWDLYLDRASRPAHAQGHRAGGRKPCRLANPVRSRPPGRAMAVCSTARSARSSTRSPR